MITSDTPQSVDYDLAQHIVTDLSAAGMLIVPDSDEGRVDAETLVRRRLNGDESEAGHRTVYWATYMWAGAFVDETTSVQLDDGTVEAAIEAMPEERNHGHLPFGFEIVETTQKLFVAVSDGEVRWQGDGTTSLGHWYFGDELSLEDITARNRSLADAGKFDILLANMRGNNWPVVVRTIAGNFKPVESNDTVLPASMHPHYTPGTEGE